MPLNRQFALKTSLFLFPRVSDLELPRVADDVALRDSRRTTTASLIFETTLIYQLPAELPLFRGVMKGMSVTSATVAAACCCLVATSSSSVSVAALQSATFGSGTFGIGAATNAFAGLNVRGGAVGK